MATATQQPKPDQQYELTAILDDRFALQLRHLFAAGCFAVFFAYYNYLPIFPSDIWGHVAYGEWILERGAIPVEDPFVSLAEGVRMVNTAWLGQVIFAAVYRVGGAEWLPNVFALVSLATAMLLARVFFLQTGRLSAALGGLFLCGFFMFGRHAIIRPEVFGGLCFAGLLWLIARCDSERSRDAAGVRTTVVAGVKPLWFAVPVLFAVWANLHGSVIVGLAVLGCHVLGRAIEVLWNSRSLKSLIQDVGFRRRLLIAELAMAATLLNPYGMDLMIQTVLMPSNPNLNDLVEWLGLGMVSTTGLQIGLAWLLTVVLLRHSRARMKPADVLLLGLFSVAVCLRVRMVTWFAPVVMVVLMPHLVDVVSRVDWTRWRVLSVVFDRLHARSFRYTAVFGLVVWMAFAFSPISRPVLGGKPRAAGHLYHHSTPLGVTKYLREHPPVGQIVNPQWWGDWLVFDGPEDLRVFMTTNATQVAPRRVWKNFQHIARGLSGTDVLLDRYRVNTIVVDKERQEQLMDRVLGLGGWTIAYEDDISLVAIRKVQESKSEPATP